MNPNLMNVPNLQYFQSLNLDMQNDKKTHFENPSTTNINKSIKTR